MLSKQAKQVKNNVEKPKLGCAPFSSIRRNILSENINMHSAFADIIDNVVGLSKVNNKKYTLEIELKYSSDNIRKIYEIVIRDNVSHGFKDILNEGYKNPLNMGHIRAGHFNDKETSEFGIGLKKSLIYLCDDATIYTRSSSDTGKVRFIEVYFDFNKMAAEEVPELSYEYSKFDVNLSKESFKQIHKYDEGSTIILKNLRQESLGNKLFEDEEEVEAFEREFMEKIGHKYRKILEDDILDIFVNKKKVEAEVDLEYVAPKSQQEKYELYINLKKNNDIVIENSYLYDVINKVWLKYDDKAKNKKFKKMTSKKDERDRLSVFEDNSDNIAMIEIFSCCTKNDGPVEDEIERKYKYFGKTEMVRDGRSFGEVNIFNAMDGYSNHTYSKISWVSKRLNMLIGVASNKTVDIKENKLYNLLSYIIRITSNKWLRFSKEITKNKRKTNTVLEDSSSSEDDSIEVQEEEEEDEEIIITQKPKEKAKESVKEKAKVVKNVIEEDDEEDEEDEEDDIEEVKEDKIEEIKGEEKGTSLLNRLKETIKQSIKATEPVKETQKEESVEKKEEENNDLQVKNKIFIEDLKKYMENLDINTQDVRFLVSDFVFKYQCKVSQ
jgi:hypothetical protein